MSTSLNTQRLKECRERIGVSKMEVAKRSGLSQPAYIISKKDNLELFSIIKLCSNAKSNDLKRILSYAKKLNVLGGI